MPESGSRSRWILPTGQVQQLIQRLKSTYAMTSHLINNCSTGNNISVKILREKFNKAELSNMTMQIIENMWKSNETFADLEATLNDYTVINENHEEMTEKILQKLTEMTKVELTKCFNQSNQNEMIPKKQIVSNEKQVLIINEINNKDIMEDKSFSKALKENISDKMEGIPVSKTTLNREGKAVLMFPNSQKVAPKQRLHSKKIMMSKTQIANQL